MKKGKYSKLLVSGIFLFLIAFTVACLCLQSITGAEVSPTLIGCVFGFCGGEAGLLSWIKTSKVKYMSQEEGEK